MQRCVVFLKVALVVADGLSKAIEPPDWLVE